MMPGYLKAKYLESLIIKGYSRISRLVWKLLSIQLYGGKK
jgi:hypothetical protein